MVKKIIYLDNAATTCVDKAVAKKVDEVFLELYGNASSPHKAGKDARELVEKARKKIADFIGAKPNEIIFTSGGTESNNLAIKGLALHEKNKHKKHVITSKIEHPSVLETCKNLEENGYNVDYISVNSDGIVDINELKKKIRNDTLLVSVMHVNNEIGTIQPIEEIGKICRAKGVYFHCDCVQSFCKLDVNVEKMNVDLISVSGHKIHAPKGVGFLYVREGVNISPIFYGGGQESGLRSGTENVPGIVGLGAALDINKNKNKIEKMRNKILEGVLKIPGARLNGSRENRIYNNINVSFYGIEGESLLMKLDEYGICASTGSACSSHKLEESHVLRAIGADELYTHGSLRITLDDIDEKTADYVIEKIKKSVSELVEMSPFKLGEIKGKGDKINQGGKTNGKKNN